MLTFYFFLCVFPAVTVTPCFPCLLCLFLYENWTYLLFSALWGMGSLSFKMWVCMLRECRFSSQSVTDNLSGLGQVPCPSCILLCKVIFSVEWCKAQVIPVENLGSLGGKYSKYPEKILRCEHFQGSATEFQEQLHCHMLPSVVRIGHSGLDPSKDWTSFLMDWGFIESNFDLLEPSKTLWLKWL